MSLEMLARKSVLVIDDEFQMRHLISTVLQRAGARVFTAADGVDGLRRLYETQPDLVILDVLMPRMDGWQVLRNIRQMTETPVIILTVLGGSENEVRALREGADDFVSKPFDVDALIARVEATLKSKRVKVGTGIYNDGYLAFDLSRRRVTISSNPVHLTRKEFELLNMLIEYRGRICSYDSILGRVWGGRNEGSVENVHVFIWQLRQKIEPEPNRPVYILNQPGIGYVFAKKPTSA